MDKILLSEGIALLASEITKEEIGKFQMLLFLKKEQMDLNGFSIIILEKEAKWDSWQKIKKRLEKRRDAYALYIPKKKTVYLFCQSRLVPQFLKQEFKRAEKISYTELSTYF